MRKLVRKLVRMSSAGAYEPACYPEVRRKQTGHESRTDQSPGVCTMEKQNFVHDFQQKLLEMFRASPAADLERNVKALMGQTFNKLELVTRDEFEIQVELLRALRSRVEALEARLDQEPAKARNGDASRSRGAEPLRSAGQGLPPEPFENPTPS